MIRAFKQSLRRVLPLWVLDSYRRIAHRDTWFDYQDRSRQEVFTYIYERGVWGRSGEAKFYSGPGSDDAVTAPYVAAIRRFIETHAIRSVIDLGCGDFRVGSQLVLPHLSYHGIDIVAKVIDHNVRTYGSPNVRFSCLDAVSSDLPSGDLCLVREVFQHLSNEEIGKVLARCRKFPFVIVTEKVAAPGSFGAPNVDITHGPNTRADTGSGVILDAPPFSEHVVGTLLDSPQPDGKILRSVVIENGKAPSV
jgi:SAM-dependent methyltransferase